jgi:predicted RNase H-like HicB family nuclease
MQNASKKRVTNKSDDAGRPFGRAILHEAREIAEHYRIVLEPDAECGFVGTSLEMPGVMGDGETPDACVRHVREGLVVGVAYLLESGKAPPLPADKQIRNRQINIRVTEAEQRRLKEAARANGFTDVSDFIRTKLLSA